jgi:IPT/TIG domain
MMRLYIFLLLHLFVLFAHAQTKIVRYEYWFDDRYNNRTIIDISPSQPLFNFSGEIPVDPLEEGYHIFNMRFEDSLHQWSSIQSTRFVKLGLSGPGNMISGYRYWFDGNSGNTSYINLSSGARSVIITDSVQTLSLDTGFHTFYFQTKDTAGSWSSIISKKFRRVGSPRITGIFPNNGGNTGDVTINITGDGFLAGTQVRLIRNTDTIRIADTLLGNFSANRLQATADLRGRAIGKYTVQVEVPGDTTMNVTEGFEIVTGVAANVKIDIAGPGTVRPAVFNRYSFVCTNSGNVNATGQPVWIAIPGSSEFRLINPRYKPSVSGIDFDTIPLHVLTDTIMGEAGSYKLIPLIVPFIGANSSFTITLEIASNSLQLQKIKVWTTPSFYQSPLNENTVNCIEDIIVTGIGSLGPVPGCIAGGLDAILRPYINEELLGISREPTSVLGYTDMMMSFLGGCLTNAQGIPLFPKVETVLKKYADVKDKRDLVLDCLGAILELTDFNINTVTSRDPNEKWGPSSLNTVHQYTNDLRPYSYVIQFENDSAATAPAQKVIILDSLDKSVYDMASFSLGSLHFTDTTIAVPNGVKSLNMDIDLRNKGLDILCRVTAGLDTASGIIRWEFESLDPVGLNLITDPLNGFLPPNNPRPLGEGSVLFSINVKQSMPLNTPVNNRAFIYFDNLQAIATQVWRNKIDNMLPVSRVNELPQFQTDSNFLVSWAGTDTSSGILDYTIFFAVNNGPAKTWLYNTKAHSAVFNGNSDSSYCFYSIARDSALNLERIPLAPDACTRVNLPTSITSPQAGGESGLLVFPNPVKKNATLRYHHLQPGFTSIELYSSNGVKIKNLYAGWQSRGIHQLTLQFPAVSNGFYILQMNQGNLFRTARLYILQ